MVSSPCLGGARNAADQPHRLLAAGLQAAQMILQGINLLLLIFDLVLQRGGCLVLVGSLLLERG